MALDTDASDMGIGAVQEQDGRVITYFSHALSKSERNYSIIQKSVDIITNYFSDLSYDNSRFL